LPGASVSPLPLPATPLRDGAKKEPAPPRWWEDQPEHHRRKQFGVSVGQLDIENLMSWTNSQLQLRYRYI